MNVLLQLYPGDRIVWIMTSVLLQATLIFAIALLFGWCFARRRPALRHGVLTCALVCCLVSPILTVLFDLSGVRFVEVAMSNNIQSSPTATQPQPNSGDIYGALSPETSLEDPFDEFPADQAVVPVTRTTNLSAGRQFVVEQVSNTTHLRTASGMLVTIWFGVGLVLFVRLLLGWRFVSRIIRESKPLTDPRVAEVLQSVVRSLGMGQTPLLACSGEIPGPITVGVLRPRVILPKSLINSVDEVELRHLLLHECAHVVRRDCLVGLVQRCLRILYWPHPLVHVLYRQLAMAREEVCDNYVLLSSERSEYGSTLLDLAEMFRSRNTVPLAMGLLSRHGNLERRIHGILDPRRTLMTQIRYSLLIGFFGSFLCVVMAVAGTRVLYADPADDSEQVQPKKPSDTTAPRIIATAPKVGATDVAVTTTEITVTFDRDMQGGFSWTGGGEDYPPSPEGKKPVWRDRRTCVLPVELKSGRYYRVGINSASFQNFKGTAGIPARPSAIYFATVGASDEVISRIKKPEIIKMNPKNGVTNVDPGLKELRVTFNVPMEKGFSWTGGGAHFPKVSADQPPHWSKDRKTCVLLVELKPNWEYRLGLNSPSHKNFQSAGGVPLDPIIYTFKTRAE